MTERFLYLEAPCLRDDECSEIQVHNVVANSLAGVIGICSSLHELDVLPYVVNEYPLPDGQPMRNMDEKKKKKKKVL